MRMSDWSSDVCSSDLQRGRRRSRAARLCWPRRIRRKSSSLHPVQSDFLENVAGFGPVFIDLDMQEEVNGLAEDFRQFLARRFAAGTALGAALAGRSDGVEGQRVSGRVDLGDGC